MRLIDADALKTKKVRSTDRHEWVVPVAEIDWMPTIEPERKTGKWVRALDGNDGHVRCSQCMKIYYWDVQAQHYGYCPNCGAKMEEGE